MITFRTCNLSLFCCFCFTAIFIDTRTQRLNRQLRFSNFASVNQTSEQLTTKGRTKKTANVTENIELSLHVNENCSNLLYSTLLYSTLLYSTLLYSTLLYSTLLYSPLLYSTLLYSTLLYSTLLHSTLLLLCSTPVNPALLYSTLLFSAMLLYSLLFHCVLFHFIPFHSTHSIPFYFISLIH